MKMLKKIIKFYEIYIGAFLTNGYKQEEYKKYLKDKYGY